MTTYTIDKGIPAPKKTRGRPLPPVELVPPRVRYPFHDMAVGDSFFVPGLADFGKVTRAASQYARRHGWRFVCRRDGDGGRCWRIA